MISRMLVAVALGALCLVPPPAAGQAASAETLFQQAKQALTGANKNEPEAKRLLLEAVADPALGAVSRCYAYVYLGYIEDRAGNRDEAIAWYRKALEVPGQGQGIRALATGGLTKPITWILDLDQGTPTPAPAPAPAPAPPKELTIGRGYVTATPPEGLPFAQTLSPAEWRENFDILWEAVDRTCATLQLKSIDWQAVRLEYEKRLESVTSTADFYRLLFRLVAELKDSHASIQGYGVPAPQYRPGALVDLFEGKPYIHSVAGSEAPAAGVKAGSELLEVDGASIDEKMEAMRAWFGGFSSERAYRRQAAGYLLAGALGNAVTFKVLTPEGEARSFTLHRGFNTVGQRAVRQAPFNLTLQKFVHYGLHPSGAGYIRIDSFSGREEIADEFDLAMDKLEGSSGLVIDIRDNTGGYGVAHARIVGRFIEGRTLVGIGYSKDAPEFKELRRSDQYLGPLGKSPYRRPVALLISDVTGSAADLFTCYMRSVPGLVTVGSTTHGNLSGVAVYAVLPCGAVVRISNGYVSDANDKPIESNGSAPDIPVAWTIADFLNGRDPVLDMAVATVTDPNRAR